MAPQEPPEDMGIVIEGVKVLYGLTSVASACALLLGLLYALNLAYPKPLRFTFEVLQKIIMQLDQHKMSPKVQNLDERPLSVMHVVHMCSKNKVNLNCMHLM